MLQSIVSRIYGISGLLLLTLQLQAQININTSPPRLYYQTAAGSSSKQHIAIANRSNKPLELVVSVSDWNYDSLGNNHFYEAGQLPASCAGWISVKPSPYITLAPQEHAVLTVTMTPPPLADTSQLPVRTAMIFLTQLNPGLGAGADGASVRVALQVGTKIYHSFSEKNNPSVVVTNFTDMAADSNVTARQQQLELTLENNGKGWVEGSIETELFNQATGKKTKLQEMPLYSLPGDRRKITIALPASLAGGLYTATTVIDYGRKNLPEIAELEFYLNK